MPSLTSISLVYLVSVLVAVLLIGLLWAWPRLGGRGPRYVLLRLVALGAVQATALSLIFIVVNYQFGFYSSWTDLLGKATGGGTLVRLSPVQVSQSAPLVIQASSPLRLKGAGSAGGTLDRVRIRGGLSGLSATGHVYLPPGYPAPHRLYPVILVISGASAGSGYSASQLAADAASAISSGKLPPVILITLPVPAADPGCLDLPGGDQAGLFFAQDVPAALASAFHTAANPGGWALLGDQAGGYCALQLSLTNAASFAAAALPPGGYESPPGGFPPGTIATFRAAGNLLWLLQHYPMQPVSLLFTGSGPNPYRTLARPPLRAATMPLSTGPAALTPVLKWLRARLAAGTGA